MSSSLAIASDVPSFAFNNAFHAFLSGLQALTHSSQNAVARKTKISQSKFYRLCHNPDPTGFCRETVAAYLNTFYRKYRRTEGFNALWNAHKPKLDEWVSGFRTKRDVDIEKARAEHAKFASREKTPLDDYVDALLEKRTDLTLIDLEEISRSHLGHDRRESSRLHPVKEYVQRTIHFLAPVDPATYFDHEERLTEWTNDLKSLFAGSAKDGLGFAASEILSRSFVEGGLSRPQFASLFGVQLQTLLNLCAGTPSTWPVIEKCSFGLSRHALQGPWLETAMPYFDGIEARFARDYPHLKEKEHDAISTFVKGLRRRISDDWCDVSLGVIQRAVIFKQGIAVKLPFGFKLHWSKDLRAQIISDPRETSRRTPAMYREGLETIADAFKSQFPEGVKDELMLPRHLHNKSGRVLGRHEIVPQAEWLLSLQIPKLY
jgi:hypothetical protein